MRYVGRMAVRQRRQLKKPITRPCQRCGVVFSGQTNRWFCGANCKGLAWAQARRARLRALQGRSLHSTWGQAPGSCLVCGTSFVGHKDKRYCSVRCGDRARRPGRREYDRQRARAYRTRNKSRLRASRTTEQALARRRTYYRLYRMKNREKLIAYQREWRHRNAEKVREAGRRQYAKMREFRLQSTRRWAKEHPAVHAHNEAARRARKRSADGSHTLAEWMQLLEQAGYRCFYCGLQSGRLTRDHVIPLVRGGSDRISNIRAACAGCNSRKGRLTGAEFRERLIRDSRRNVVS